MKKYSDIGKRLKKLRGSLSQREFAKKIGLPHKTYQRYEYGEGIPKAHTLKKIAQKESVTVDWLLTGSLRSFEEMIRAKEMGVPISLQGLTSDEVRMVDHLRKKGFSIPFEVDNIIDSKLYGATMLLFSESSDIFGLINAIMYSRKEGKFQSFCKIVEQIGRIFLEGNETKLEAVTSSLKALDPGEKKQDPGGHPRQKTENNDTKIKGK